MFGGEGILLPQLVEDPLRRMPLLRGGHSIFFLEWADHPDPQPQFGLVDWPLPPIAQQHGIPEHLAYGLACHPKLLRYDSLLPSTNTGRSTRP
jgi:hypothetical protein